MQTRGEFALAPSSTKLTALLPPGLSMPRRKQRRYACQGQQRKTPEDSIIRLQQLIIISNLVQFTHIPDRLSLLLSNNHQWLKKSYSLTSRRLVASYLQYINHFYKRQHKTNVYDDCFNLIQLYWGLCKINSLNRHDSDSLLQAIRAALQLLINTYKRHYKIQKNASWQSYIKNTIRVEDKLLRGVVTLDSSPSSLLTQSPKTPRNTCLSIDTSALRPPIKSQTSREIKARTLFVDTESTVIQRAITRPGTDLSPDTVTTSPTRHNRYGLFTVHSPIMAALAEIRTPTGFRL